MYLYEAIRFSVWLLNLKCTMIAVILSVAVLLGLASGGAVPQYSSYHHHHHQHARHHQNHHIKETHIIKTSSPELEAPIANNVGLLLIMQNPIGLCREDSDRCPCYNRLRDRKKLDDGDSYPLWTVESLWQGAVPRSRTQPQTLRVCKEERVAPPVAEMEFNKLPDQDKQCLRSVWPPLDDALTGDCTEDSAIIEEGVIQGNCATEYEHFSHLDMYYSQVALLYEHANGKQDSCHNCGYHRTEIRDNDISQPDGSTEKIHIALTQLGLTNNKTTMIDPADLKKYFDHNVYIGCTKSTKSGALNSWIITRIGFCFRCPRGSSLCDLPEPVDCWSNPRDPPSTVPWSARNMDSPCYTEKQKVCYCGFDRSTDCAC